ncbi:MAG: hypothetical protein J6A28_00320 [Clostridia bacterium]|nr:hypothetical protein [Clostridia bacterium]
MSEKSLLLEIEKEKQQIVEKQLARAREKQQEKETEEALKSGKTINIFSSATFPQASLEFLQEKQQEEEEVDRLESKVSQVIEKPNYDMIEGLSQAEREKIFKIEKEEVAKPQVKFGKLKWIMLSILLAIFGVWGLINIATLDNLAAEVASVEAIYNINIATYAKNLATLDATSAENMENLLPTIPDQKLDANQIGEQSNWFDRFCNFIGGLFGG